MTTELIPSDINELTSYSSIVAKTREEKALLYNAVNSPDYTISDFIGKKIEIADVVIEKVDTIAKDTGEVVQSPRVVLIDKNKKSYSCVSFGIFNAVKKLTIIFGNPSWADDPICVEVQNITTQNGRKVMTLKAL